MRKGWFEHFAKYEGQVAHFYLDGAGVVTVGVGCVVYEPGSIRMVRRTTGVDAAPEEVKEEYQAVKGLEAGKTASGYEKYCKLVMLEEEQQRLLAERLDETEAGLARQGIVEEGVPAEAWLAIVDMAFNLGVAGLAGKFPKFVAAWRDQDWEECAAECERKGVQASRNAWTKAVFEGLA